MKRFQFICLILFAACFESCSNDDDGTRSKLPDLTTEGKHTFGCKINGGIFLPRDAGGFNLNDPIPILYLKYGYHVSNSGGYHFSLFADNELLHKAIYIEMEQSQIPLVEGIYSISSKEEGKFAAGLIKWSTGGYSTSNDHIGELEIIKLDTINSIMAGTFWFNAVNQNGEILQVRDGRFDIRYRSSF